MVQLQNILLKTQLNGTVRTDKLSSINQSILMMQTSLMVMLGTLLSEQVITFRNSQVMAWVLILSSEIIQFGWMKASRFQRTLVLVSKTPLQFSLMVMVESSMLLMMKELLFKMEPKFHMIAILLEQNHPLLSIQQQFLFEDINLNKRLPNQINKLYLDIDEEYEKNN